MKSVKKDFLETGTDCILSPEHWISEETLVGLNGSKKLSDVALLKSKQETPPPAASFVLDTGHAREGLLDLPILANPENKRTSNKKVAQEGDVIISRLRPYLRQVAWIPYGSASKLGIEKFYCSTEFLIFRRKDGKNAAGLVAWLLSDPIQDILTQAATGGHHPRIGPELLLNAPIEEKYLDEALSSSIARVLTDHVNGQRELLVLLRH